jgi:hemerythrin
MNKLYESVKSGTEESIVTEILQGLSQYAHYHFSIEEGWFLVTDYPNS